MGQLKRDCPHCHTKNSAFIAYGEQAHAINTQLLTVGFYCGGCYGGLVATVFRHGGKSPIGYLGDLDEFTQFEVREVYPESVEVKAPAHLPPNIESYFLQAARSLEGRNYDASGTMSRKALDTATRKLNPDGKGNLYKRIEALGAKHLITPDLKDWAHIIRDDGNDAAHEEEPTTPEAAQELLDFTELFLMYTFTMPGMVEDKKRVEVETDDQNQDDGVEA